MGGARSNMTDIEIVDLVLGGEIDAFALILERYRSRVFGIIGKRVARDDIEEVAEEVFVRVYTSLGSYRGTGGFNSWVSKIAVRTAHDYWREKYRRREQPMSSLSDDQLSRLAGAAASQSSREFDDRQSLDEARELLSWALGKLSPEDRAVLELVHLEGRPVKEAAELLGWSVANVKVRAYRSRRKLRSILAKVLAERGDEG
jgi:RNA polymerase sigma-70 factor (ECF subfamily)